MRWTNRVERGAGFRVRKSLGAKVRKGNPRDAAVWPAFLLLASATLLGSLLVSGATPDKHLSVYSVAANYSLPLVVREGHDYVGLLEVLEPLGKVSAKADGSKWRLKYNSVPAEFQAGKTRARIQNHELELGGKFLIENSRGLVPIGALASLLPRILGGPVSLHEVADRLFIGNVATHFTASLAGDNPPRLVFHFSAPVSPSIASDAATVRMTFPRDPVVGPASPTLTFGNKVIPSATYSEGNGSAMVTVNSTTPLAASSSGDGRTITIAPKPTPAAVAQAVTPNAAAPPPVAGQASAVPAASTPVPGQPAPRRYFAVVDASHGGDDHGETLSTTLLEKDITVALAHSLRQQLENRGITTLVLRDSDANLPVDQRAIFANADHAAIYIAVHASSLGRGVRVYTALLPYGGDDHGPFRSWATAQHSALPLSQSTASAVAGELQKRQVPVRTLIAPLRPLNNVTGPAIAIEVAPEAADATQLMAPDYQELVMSAVATAIAANRDQLGGAP